jgi:hypothetical protein
MRCSFLSVALPFCLLAAAPGPAAAVTRTVTTCADSGPGSLRAVVAAAHSGDLIDMRGLACTRILLTTGQIVVHQPSLTLLAAGESKLTIDGNNTSRVLLHVEDPSAPWSSPSTATLRLQRLSIAHGFDQETQGASGGCIVTRGNVRLWYAQVHHCTARSTTPDLPYAQGGAIFALGNVVMFHASVFSSSAVGGTDTVGGGIYSFGLLHVDHSSIHDNSSAGEAGGAFGNRVFVTYSTIRDNDAATLAGGLIANGATVFNKSTLSGNQADHIGGGAFSDNGDVVISDSTISGNRSLRTPAGIEIDGRFTRVSVVNTTIAYNTAGEPFSEFADGGGITQSGTVRYNSSIIARNTVGGAPNDIWAQVNFGARMTGANNLIEATNLVVPADTISADPLLAPLADNGGPTRTHALLATSPAIDHGNNIAGFVWDQRGEGFPRVNGPQADIGAFER